MEISRARRMLFAVPVVLLALTAVVPSASNAAPAKSKVKRPADGKWKFYVGHTTGPTTETKGTLTVSKHGTVAKDLSVIPPTFCGTKRLTVLGKFKIRPGGPGGGTEFYVGKTHNTSTPVTIKLGATRETAQLSIYFLDNVGDADVTVVVPNCGDLGWGAAAPKKKK